MTIKTSYGFVLWAVPRFHRAAAVAPGDLRPQPLITSGIGTLPAEKRPATNLAATQTEKAAGLNETNGCSFAYH